MQYFRLCVDFLDVLLRSLVLQPAVCYVATIKPRKPRQVSVLLSKGSFWLLGCCLFALLASGPPLHAEAISLRPNQIAERLSHVRVEIEIKGELKLNAEGSKVKRLPLRVDGKLAYEERTLPRDRKDELKRLARFYDTAAANITIDRSNYTSRLDDSLKLVIAEAGGAAQGVTMYSPSGPLNRSQLDLINVPVDSAVLDQLLPEQPVAVGGSWKHSSSALATLFSLDAVTQSEVSSTLRNVERNVAHIEMSGKFSGAAGGVSSDLEVRAKYQFDLRRRQISWIGVAVREDRAIGHAEPGFEVVTRLSTLISAEEKPQNLTDQVLDTIPAPAKADRHPLVFRSSPGGFQILQDRRWRVMLDRRDVCVMRLVENGDLVAQCNISRLPELPAGRHLALDELQNDVQRTLDKQFQQFVEATQETSGRGLRVLRVAAVGNVSDLPIQWIYYHVSDPQGRRVALVFTLETKLVGRLGGADQSLVESLELFDLPETQSPSPTPAEPKNPQSAAGGPAPEPKTPSKVSAKPATSARLLWFQNESSLR